MKTVKVTRDTRKLIEEYREEGETIDATVKRLLNSSEPLEIVDRTITNINLDEETLNILKTYKAYGTQSHNDTLLELLKKAK